MEDNKRKLYDALSQEYDLGSFEQFSADIADDTKRRKLYDATSEEYDYGDYDSFSKQLGFGVEPSRSTPEVGQVEQPARTIDPQAAAEGHAMFQAYKASRNPDVSTPADAPQATQQYMEQNPVKGGSRQREQLMEQLGATTDDQNFIQEYDRRYAKYQQDTDNDLTGPEQQADKAWLDDNNQRYREAKQKVGEIQGRLNLMDKPEELERIAGKKKEIQDKYPALFNPGGYKPDTSRRLNPNDPELPMYKSANEIYGLAEQTLNQGSKYDPGYEGNWLEQAWTAARQFAEGGINNIDTGSLTFGASEGIALNNARKVGDKSNEIVNSTIRDMGYTDASVNKLLQSVDEDGKKLASLGDELNKESAELASMKATLDDMRKSGASEGRIRAYAREYNKKIGAYNKRVKSELEPLMASYEKSANEYETLMSAIDSAVEGGLTDGEKALLDALEEFTDAKMKRAEDVSIASAAGAGAEQSAEFMLDFILTGGLAKAGTKAATKLTARRVMKKFGAEAAAKVVRPSLGAQIATDAVVAAARTTAMFPRNLAAYGEQLTQMTGKDNLGRYNFDRSHLNAALNTALTQYIEYWSEGFGEYFGAGEQALFRKATKAAPRTAIGKTLGQYRGSIGKYLDYGKFDGMFNEMVEEVVGAHLNALAGWMSGDRVGDKNAIVDFYSGENMATLALSFLPMSAISARTNIKAYNKMKNRYNESVAVLNPFLESGAISREELEGLVSNIAEKTPEEIKDSIVSIADKARAANGGFLPQNFTQSLMGYVEGSFAMSLNNETWENSQEKLGVVNAYTEQYSNPDDRNAYDLAQLESEARAAAMQAGFDENMLDLDSYSIARHAQALQQSDPRQAQVLLGYAVAKSANQGLKDGYDAETRQLFDEIEKGIQEISVNGNVIRATAPDGNLVFITSQDASVGADGNLSTPTGADGLVSYVDPNGRTLQAKASAFTGVTATPTEYYILDQESNFFDARNDAFEQAQNTISPAGKARALNANIGNTVFFRMNGIYEPMQVDRLTQGNTNVVVSGDPKFLNGLATMLGLQSPGGQSMELPIETIWPMLDTNDDGSLVTNQPEVQPAPTSAQPAATPSQPTSEPEGVNPILIPEEHLGEDVEVVLDGNRRTVTILDVSDGKVYYEFEDENGDTQTRYLPYNDFMNAQNAAANPRATGTTATSETPAAPAEQPQAPVAEETPAEEAPKSKIPVDKDGNKIYDAPGVEPIDAYDDMYSTPGLTEEDVDEWVIAQSEEAEKNRNPKIKKGQSLQDWGKEKAEANRKADFWKQFRDIAEERAKEREEARRKEAERQKEIEKYGVDTRGFDLTPQTVEEAVADYLGNNDGIIDLDDAKKEVFGKSGRIPSELFRHVGNGGILTKKGGRTIADVANDIVGEYEGQLPIEQDAVRDIIIDYLARYTKTEMRDVIFQNRLKEAIAAKRDAENAPDANEQQNGERDVNAVIDAARAGDKASQEQLQKYGIDWGTAGVYRFASKGEVDSILAGGRYSGRFEGTGVDVTASDTPTSAASADYRITFKAQHDLYKDTEEGGNRAVMKNKQLKDGHIREGYDLSDVALIEKRNEDGTYTVVYDSNNPNSIPAEEAVEEAPEGTAVPEVEEPVAEPAEPEPATAEEDVLLENETQEIRDAVDNVVSGKDTKKREIKSTLPDDFTIGGMDVNSYIRSRYDRFKEPLEKRREEIRKEYVAYRDRVEDEARADILRNNPQIKEDNPYLPDYVSEEANKRLKNDEQFNALDAQIKAIDDEIGNYQTRRYNALAAIEEIYESQKPAETPENNAPESSETPENSVPSQVEEAPAQPEGPQMLTEQEIRNSGFSDEDVIDAAVDYINGNHGFAETLAYNQIEEYVRTQRSTTEQTGSNADQTQLDGPVVRTGGVAAEQSGSQPGELGGNQETGTSERVPGSENGGVSAGVRGAANAQGAGLSSDAGSTGSERRGGSNRAGQSGRSSDDRGAGSESAPVAGQPGEQGTATQTGSAGLGDAGRERNVDQGRSGAGVPGGQNEQGAQGLADAQPARVEIEAGSTDIEALGGELEDLLKQFSNTTPSIDRDINGLDSVSHSVDTSGDEEGRLSRKQPKRPTAPLSLEGMTPQQMQLAGKILFSAAKLGYAFAKTEGLTTYNDFHRWFTGKFGDAVMKGLNYNETSLDAFIREVWNTKMKIDGERLTLEQHSQELHNAELREQSDKSEAERTRLQKEANEKKIPFKAANRKNIAEALPQLIPGQWDDVVAIERQFFDPSHNDYDHAYGKGMLITNGTGTGKTFTGLGVIKRFLDQGKGRILLVAPASMTGEWVDKAKIMGITATKLANTKDKGKGVVVTSYENFRENRALYEDDFDLVVYDECQNIIENQKGEDTLAFEAHKRITNKNVEEAMDRLVANTQPGRRKFELEQENDRLETERKKRSTRESRINEIVIRQREIEQEIQDLDRQIALLKPSFQQKAEEAVKKTKVLMLSATPFNTVQNLKFAEGYIFQYPKVFKSDGTEVLDEASRQSAFVTEWFRGDEPMEDMEIAFGDHLLDELETASYRELENGFDHSRDFPDVSGNVMASRFNAAWQAIQKDPRFQELRDYTKFLTDPTWTTQLFETMKVSAIRERLKEHLDAGRKIVIFHDRVHETQSTEKRPAVGPPFATVLEQALLASTQGKQTPVAAIAEFRQRFADVLAWEQTLDYRPVHEQIVDLYATDADRATFAREMEEYNRKMQQWQQDVQEFERRNPQMTPEELYEKMPKAPKRPQLKAESVAVYNGEKTDAEKDAAKAAFNDDNSKVKIICVTTRSGGAGLSLHDTTGKYPRVMIQTALPVSPIGFIQAEGRIFRWGNKSNAVFEYPRLGIDLEAYVFAMQFNAKAETVENLAHGFRGRGLKDSIMTGFWENSGNVPIDGQGIGGVEMDKRGNTLKGMAKAKHDYGVVQRKGVKEGDTSIPEPVGFKMAEWAKAQAGDNALIPFAGRGSIARYVPKGVSTSALEDNVSLQSDLMVTSGGADFKIREGNFTELNMINKADVVLLNGATDQGGLDQIDTFKKGFGHLSEGGRLIAIVPDNAAANNAIAEITGNLGGALRATIKVRNEALDRGEGTSRIVVLDKISSPQLRATAGQPVTVDLTNSTKEQVFDLLENVNIPDRIIDKEAIAVKKLNALGTEFRKNRFVEDFKVTQYGRNQYITINYRRKPNGFNTAKRALDVIGKTGYYDRGSGRQYKLSDFDNPSQYHQYIKAYQVISEVLQMDDAEFRKFAMIENSAKAEDVDALRELYRLYQKMIRAAFGLTDSQIRRVLQGMRPDVSASDIETLNSYEELRAKFEAANHDDQERQDLYDKIAPIGEQLGLTIGAEAMDRDFLGGYNNVDNSLKVNKLRWNTISDDKRATTLLHEFIHSVTVYALAAYNTNAPGVSDALFTAAKLASGVFDQVQRGAAQDVRPFTGFYAIENEKEIMAEMANPEFREKLKNRRMWVQRSPRGIRVSGAEMEGAELTNAWALLNEALDGMLKNFDKSLFDRFRGRVNDFFWEVDREGKPYREANYGDETDEFKPKDIFVSNAASAASRISVNKATPEQWLRMLEKEGGLKAGEDKWIGLSDWLKASDKKTLTKQEVLDYINRNKIVVEEQHYAAMNRTDTNEQRFFQFAVKLTDEMLRIKRTYNIPQEEAYKEVLSRYGEGADNYLQMDSMGLIRPIPYIDPVEALKFFEQEVNENEVRPIDSIRLDYTTSGLDNYREIALTVPSIQPWNEDDDVHFGDAGGGRAVAWVRFGETRDSAGRRVLVIDEVQSKRHQEGREHGYQSETPDTAAPLREELAQKERRYAEIEATIEQDYDNDQAEAYRLRELQKDARNAAEYEQLEQQIQAIYDRIHTRGGEYNRLRAEIRELQDRIEVEQRIGNYRREGRIPDAPFEKNLHELAMKRMLRYAAENGYDVLAWTTGDQQAERYSLSKVISGVETVDNHDGTRNVYLNQDGAPDIELHVNSEGTVTGVGNRYHQEFVGKKLSDIIGKELASRTMSTDTDEVGNAVTVAEGTELRIGGEGMKGFYDEIIPRYMNKYGKKWGVSVNGIELPVGEDGKTIMHSVPVTGAMKESVLEGQLLFREDQTAARVRQKEDPKKTIKVYKLMRLGDDGKLYPLFIDSSAGISIGEWYDAESPDMDFLKKMPSGVFLVNPADGSYTSLEDYANEHGFKAGKFPPKDAINEASVNGMRWVKITDTEKGQRRYEGENRKYENIGINGSGGVSTFAMRPGWHAGSLPTMRQIGKGPQKNLRDDSFVWVEGEVPADVDYNAEAQSNPDNDIPTHIPTDGYYMKSTNANAKAAQADKVGWYVAGSFKANRIISDAEARAVIDEYNAAHPNQEPVEYDYARESGKDFTPEERRISAAELEATNATLDRMSEEMGIKINRVGRSEMPRGHKSDKGYYNPSTGEMTICMDNVTDERDAIATVLHETVGHHGLRQLFGDRFNDAMARIYAALDQKGKTWVNGYIVRHPNADNTRAVEEYLSHLAESGDFKNTVWDNIKRIIGRIVDALFGTNGFLLTDNELNYILRASYENLKNPNWLNTVEGRAFDTLLKRQLGINETDPNKPTDPQGPDAGRLYRDGDTGIANDDYNHEMDRKWNKALTENQDADRPVKIGMDKVMKEKGIKSISEDEDYVTRHNLASSRAESEAHEFELFRFTPLMDQVRAIQSRLLGKRATSADREQAYERILDYMYAVSGLERNASKNAEIEQAKQAKLADAAAAGITDPAKLAEIEKKYDDMKRDWSGLTSLMGMSKDNWQAAETAAQGMISAFESAIGDKSALDELWNRVRACTDFSLEHAYQHGLLTREEFERLHGTASQPRMWDFYLPLRGFSETTTEEQFGYETFTNPSRGNVVVKKMNGRWTQADNPLANILNIAETEIVQGNDNWAKQALYRFTLNAGDNTLLSASEPWFVKNPATGKWSMAFPDPGETLEEFEERMKALRALDDPLAKKGRRGLKLDNIMANKAHRNEHAIHLKVGGIDKMIWVNGNPALAKAVSGIGRAQNMQWLRRASRALSNLFTTYSLDFTAKNLIRDTVYSNIALHVKEDKAYRHQYRKNWIANFGYGAFAFPMVRLAAEWDSGKLQQKEKAGTITKRERDFLNFMRDGGQTGYTIINSVNQIKKDLEKQMRSAGGRPGTVPILGWYAKAVKTLNEGFELLTRFTAYQTSRDMGRSGQRAASDAKEISVNFNRRGAQSGSGVWGNIAAYLGATHYFYNAGVQGFDNFLGLFKKKPYKMSTITAGFVIMGIATPFINSMLAGLIGGGDGDDDWYWNLPEWVRRNNLVIGTGKWYVALPLPVEFRAPYGIGDIAGAAFAYEKYPNRTFGGVAGDIITTASGILPVNPIEGYTSNGNIGDAAIRAVAPDAGMFFVDWATNRDYTGRPLWKENPFSDTVPKSQGAYASTPKGIVAACQKLAEVSNGAIDIAPGVVRDFMNNYGGGFFRAAEDVSKLLFTDEERPRRWDNVPFFSGFTGHIDEDRSNSFAQGALYDYKKLSEDNVKSMNAILNTDDVTSAVLYDEPESLYEREGVTVLQKAKIKRMLDSKDYALGKMYREGMNNKYKMKQSMKDGHWYKSRDIERKGVDALRKEWKDLRDQWASMPDKTEEQKSAKAEMDLQVQEAWHLYYDAMGDLAEKLMDYEYNKQ